jgi:hypothetical protein
MYFGGRDPTDLKLHTYRFRDRDYAVDTPSIFDPGEQVIVQRKINAAEHDSYTGGNNLRCQCSQKNSPRGIECENIRSDASKNSQQAEEGNQAYFTSNCCRMHGNRQFPATLFQQGIGVADQVNLVTIPAQSVEKREKLGLSPSPDVFGIDK